MQGKNTLGRHEKLKSRKEIDKLFAERNSFALVPVRMFYAIAPSGTGEIKAGFGSSKKYLKQAVKRNRAKRLMREAYRKQKHRLQLLAAEQQWSVHLFFLYTDGALTEQERIEVQVAALLDRLQKKLLPGTA